MADDINWAQPPTEDEQPPAKSGDVDWSQPPPDSPSKLDIAVQQGQNTPPDTAARILKLQDKTGLDPDLIGRNLDDIEKQANSKGFDAAAFQKTSPIVASWMAEHPTKAAIAQPDAVPLSAVESFFKRDISDPFLREMDAQKRWQLGEKAMNGTITPEDRDQLATIDARMAERSPQGPQGTVDSVLQNWIGNTPTLGRSLWEGAKGAAAGAVVGAVAGEGVGAVPGAGVGFTAGMSSYFARMEQANTYLEMEKQGISRPVAMGAAMTSGTITGIMMAMTGGESAKVAVPALASLQKEGLATLLSNPTTAMAMKGYLADIGKQMGIMGAFSGSSAMVHSGTEEVGKMIDDGSIHSLSPTAILSRIFSPENLASAAEATKSGMVGGAGLGMTSGLLELHGKISAANDAIQRAKDIEQAGVNLALTKVWQEVPEHAEDLVSKMTKDTPNEHAYLPMASWNEYWMKKEVDPRAAWESAAGNTDAYDESQRTGADLHLPMSKYMTTIGASEHGKNFSEEVRTDPLGMNAKEAEEFAKTEVKKADDQATNVPEPLPAPETTPITPAQLIIQKARQQQGLEDFFPDPKKVGMNDEQAASFTKAEADARYQAEQAVQDKLMRKAEKERQGILDEQREQIRKDVTEQVDARKDQFARSFLTKGTQPNGEALPEGMQAFKLSREAIKEDFSDMDTSNLPRGSVISKEKATNADIKARAEATRSRESAIQESAKQTFDEIREVLGKGISIPEDVKEEGKKLPIWMKNKEGRPLDEVRDQLAEKGFIGPNDDVFKFLETVKAPEKLPTKDAYFTRAKQELAGELSGTGGVHPDEAAPFLGFSSGQELIEALNKSQDRNEMIDGLTKNFMTGEGEIVSQHEMANAAIQAVHNDARAEVLQKGLKYMLSDNFAQAMGLVRRLTRRLPPLDEIRDQAESIIDAKIYRDTQPALYQREISKATREAGIHFTKGDFNSMFESKQRELLNHELFRAASDAKEEIDNRVADVGKYSTDKWQEKIGKAGGQYLEQLNDILDRFDFKKSTTLKELGKRQDLRAWVEDQRAQGYDPAIPEKVMNDAYRQSYKDMSNGDVKQVLDSIDSITHLANLKNKLIASAEEREFNTVKTDLINEARKNFDIKDEVPVPRRVKESTILNDSLAYMTRMEFMMDHLDGFKANGPFWENIFKPTVDAENSESVMMRTKMADLENIFGAYSREERAQWYLHKIAIPEIGTSLLKPNILMAALNWGNEYNRQALMDGYQWKENQVEAIFKHLDSRDWATVQKLWDHLETYRPDIGALEKKLNGREPEWVDSSPFTVNSSDGKTINLKGGYFPILFDNKLSWHQAILDSNEATKDLFGGNWAQAMTKTGHTEARVGTGGKPLLLQFSGLTEHMSNVIHDLTHREAVIDVNKIINDPDIRSHIQGSIGKEAYSQMNPWLKQIAGARQGDPFNPYESLLSSVRGGATIANLGLKVTSALVHVTNYSMAVNELGPKYAASGFADFYGNPTKIAENWDKITSKSSSMAAFTESFDRDIRDQFKGMNITGTREGPLSVVDAYTHNLQKALFAHYGMMYTAVAGPTWMGAYSKAMDGAMENIKAGDEKSAIDYADHVVRTTIASAAPKDLPNVMQRGGLMRLFTMYYGPMNLIFNNLQKGAQEFKMRGDFGKLAATATMSWILPSVLQQVLRGRTPSDDESTGVWAGKAITKLPFETIVGIRDIARAWESKGHDLSLSPVTDAIGGMVKGGVALQDKITGDKDELSRSDMKNLAMMAGYFTHLPTRQALATTEYVHDWLTGDEQPDSIPEGLIRSLIGKKTRP